MAKVMVMVMEERCKGKDKEGQSFGGSANVYIRSIQTGVDTHSATIKIPIQPQQSTTFGHVWSSLLND